MRSPFAFALLLVLAVSAPAQLTLPWSGVDATATLSSFQIIKSGTAGRANTLYITNLANTSDVLLVNTVGLGRAGFFSVNNVANSTQALRGESNGSGIGVFGYMTGTGRAGVFRIANATNSNYAVYAQTTGSGSALRAEAGTGFAGDFIGELNISASGAGAELLRFTTERPWVFRQTLSGPSAGLELYSTVGLKTFQITSSLGANVATFVADDANPRVGIGTTGPVAKLDVVTSVVGGAAVKGVATATTGTSNGVEGRSASTTGSAVEGKSSATSGIAYGVAGYSSSTSGRAVDGFVDAYAGANYGVRGQTWSMSPSAFGVFAQGSMGASGLKPFRIDHPFNPENEYLFHYSTESPEPLNVYRGTTVTNSRGFAWITMPDYFGEINIDPSYQLTVIDGSDDFVMAKVTKEIADNRFEIRTNKPNVKVCWRVEAKRNDLYVRKHGAPVEVMKEGLEKGTYQHPELYGKPIELSLGYRPGSAQQKR